jgi:hypothetical protein
VLRSLAALAQTYLPDDADSSTESTHSLQHKNSNAKPTATAGAAAAAGTVVVDQSVAAAEAAEVAAAASSADQRDSDDEAAAAAAVAPRVVSAHITEALQRFAGRPAYAVRPPSASRWDRAAGSEATAAAAAASTSTAAASTESTASVAARAWDRFRTGRSPIRRGSATGSAAGAAAAATAGAQQAQQCETSLEEPYAVQVAAPVFAKLHALLTRSLDAQLSSSSSTSCSSGKHGMHLHRHREAAHTRTLCLLQLTRVNFARLVATHVDPAEVGLQQQQAAGGHMHDLLLLLRSIMHCEGRSCSELRVAAADTFASGLPLLLPKCSQRLSLLLSLLRAASCSSKTGCYSFSGISSRVEQHHSAAVPSAAVLAVADTAEASSVAPDATAVLLRHVMQHFAHTQSVLQLLTLFKSAQQQRDSVAELLQLLLQALLQASQRQCDEDDCCSDALLASPTMTAMMLQLLETLQQHLGKHT